MFENILKSAQHEDAPVLLQVLVSIQNDITPVTTVVALLGIFFFVLIVQPKDSKDLPFGLSYMRYTPRWLSGSIYARSSLEVMTTAFNKAQDKAWQLVRHDTNIIMLPPSAVEEVSKLSVDIASNLHALQFDLASKPASMHMLPDAHLHARYVQRKITPNLTRFTSGMQEEVSKAVDEYFPKAEDGWITMDPSDILIKISARMSSRVNLGKEWSRDPRWTGAAIGYTQNVLAGIALMRFFPTWLYPVFHWTLPQLWKSRYHFRQAQKLLKPAFAEIIQKYKDGSLETTQVDDDSNGLTWLAQLAEEEERDPSHLVDAEILLVLASVPTTVFSEVNILLDLVSNPSLIDEVREELAEAHKAQGAWDFSTYSKLHKLDSICRESQRMSPPTLIGLRRIMRKEYTLQSGLHLPKGAYIAVPSYTIQNNEEVTPDPDKYDGLRSYKLKMQDGMDGAKHHFTTSEHKVLGWGFGRTACPGRWFASLALKMIVSKVIMEYELKFPDGQTERPKNLVAHEFLAVDPSARFMVRKRQGVSAPF